MDVQQLCMPILLFPGCPKYSMPIKEQNACHQSEGGTLMTGTPIIQHFCPCKPCWNMLIFSEFPIQMDRVKLSYSTGSLWGIHNKISLS